MHAALRHTSRLGRHLTPRTSRAYSHAAQLGGLLRVSDEVRDAVATNRPVVALESTIYTHGALGVDLRLEAIVREHGATPAVAGILDGRPCIGLAPDEIARMVAEGASKVSRRDMAHAVTQKTHGGTTIAGTMILARLAGIRVFGTGGLGGVHRGWSEHLDISADLSELGRTRVAVVSSGSKGFLDTKTTLEYLETQGVYVGTFADGRSGKVPFPAFWARESSLASPSTVVDEAEAAAIVWAQERLGLETGLLFANPIPAAYEIPRAEMEAVIDQAVREAAEGGHTGSRNTPFILTRIRQLTGERSVAANIALVQDNVARAAKVAVHLAELMSPSASASSVRDVSRTVNGLATEVAKAPEAKNTKKANADYADILVAGSVALDLSCDYAGEPGKGPAPALHTSNPASIVPTVGGVGHNVALAAHRIAPSLKVRLCTMVGSDIAGTTVLEAMKANGLDTAGVRQLGHADGHADARTAHYVAVNGADKNLMVAMADMAIFARDDAADAAVAAVAAVAAAAPRWVVVDGNWGAATLHGWVAAARAHGAQVAFEPVSVAKSARLFAAAPASVGVFPAPLVDLATPNQYELAAMHAAAAARGFVVDDARWFRVIDALGITGARERFVRLSSFALTDAGVPQQALQLLPYIPTLVTKLGHDGALLTKLLARDDPLLVSDDAAPYILARAPPLSGRSGLSDRSGLELEGEPAVGGVYMRLFSRVEDVADVVSVNGVGDTFLGALVGGLAQGGRVEQLVDVAQRAAVETLRSHESVGPDLVRLAGALTAAAHTLP